MVGVSTPPGRLSLCIGMVETGPFLHHSLIWMLTPGRPGWWEVRGSGSGGLWGRAGGLRAAAGAAPRACAGARTPGSVSGRATPGLRPGLWGQLGGCKDLGLGVGRLVEQEKVRALEVSLGVWDSAGRSCREVDLQCPAGVTMQSCCWCCPHGPHGLYN